MLSLCTAPHPQLWAALFWKWIVKCRWKWVKQHKYPATLPYLAPVPSSVNIVVAVFLIWFGFVLACIHKDRKTKKDHLALRLLKQLARGKYFVCVSENENDIRSKGTHRNKNTVCDNSHVFTTIQLELSHRVWKFHLKWWKTEEEKTQFSKRINWLFNKHMPFNEHFCESQWNRRDCWIYEHFNQNERWLALLRFHTNGLDTIHIHIDSSLNQSSN